MAARSFSLGFIVFIFGCSGAFAYTAADKGSACKINGSCGTVEKNLYPGSNSYGCHPGGDACKAISRPRPKAESKQ